jgi:CheY-like chemotaxis protein
MRIAILEDDVSQTELLSHWLQLAGHNPHAFEQGANLLRALERESFDALVLDWNVPDLSGVDVLKRVRQRLHSSVPVLFVTARNREDDVVTALREGADDYMVKPVRRLELLARWRHCPGADSMARNRPKCWNWMSIGSIARRVPCCEYGACRPDGEGFRPVRPVPAKCWTAIVARPYPGNRLGAQCSSHVAYFGYPRQPHPQQARPHAGQRLASCGVYRYGYRLEQLDAAASQRAVQTDDHKAA